MSRFTNTLGRVRVAAPCEADWDEMRGDERVRFCHRCSLNVYNLSAMTRREAERLITRTEGERLCVRFYRRRDGTMLTRPCPVGLRALKRRVSRLTSALFATAVGFAGGLSVAPAAKKGGPALPAASSAAAEEPAAAYAGSVAMGYSIHEYTSMDDQYAAGATLGFIIFVIGYPLMKLRECGESKRREALSIWRRS